MLTRTPPAEDPRWTAVLARDRASDGAFVLAVKTTGIYCRPSCPARRPHRENIAFYETPEAARVAGFRACLRCDPDRAGEPSLAARAVAAAADMIAAAIDGDQPPPALETLATRAGYAPHHFHRLFKRETGLTPRAYAGALRTRAADATLAAGATVTEALHAAGYSASRFYATAGARLGMAPKTRRLGGRGETIRHAIAETSLGRILVAATERGVCAIQFGEEPDQLEAWLRRRFPNATLTGPDDGFAATLKAVVEIVERPGHDHGLPLEIRGTAFQERVWQALLAIPAGATASYAGIAAAIGQPTAARGVASACAANAIGVAVPCHRVIRGDGSLAGYRWGVDRKAALLARERKAVRASKDGST